MPTPDPHRWAPLALLLPLLLTGCAGPAGDSQAAEESEPELRCPTFVEGSEGLPTKGEWRSHPAIGDVNGDGLGDIAALPRKGGGPSVFIGDGLGRWEDASIGLSWGRGFSCGIGSRFADVDQDGHTDLLIADHCRGLRVYRGDGGKSWSDASRGIPDNVSGFNDVEFEDIDGDGMRELVAISAFDRGFLIVSYEPGVGWRVKEGEGLPQVGGGFEIEVVDADGDGRLDIVTSFNPVTADRRQDPPPPAKVWLQNEDGSFQPADEFPQFGRYFGIATAQREGAPGRDLYFALTGARAGLWVFEPTEEGTWIERGPLDKGWFDGPSLGFLAVDTADLDGDGCTDLALGGGAPMRVWIAMGDCEGGVRVCPEPTVPLPKRPMSIWGVTIGELNGDGKPDIVAAMGAAGRGSVRAWFQTEPDTP